MIRYKVVRTEDRSSCLLQKDCKYRKIYQKGKTVRATTGTLGIFCFKTKENAKDFIDILGFWESAGFSIIKVETAGKGKVPKFICLVSIGYNTEDLFNDFYKHSKLDMSMFFREEPPDGTICYPAVKVLD